MSSTKTKKSQTITKSGRGRPRSPETREKILKAAKEIWQRGVDRGELKTDIDPEVAIDALYSQLFYRLLLKHRPLTEEFVNNLVELVINGMIIR